MRTTNPVLKLIFERISASELARRLGITPAAVLQWDHVPINRVIAVERETGISRHILRPDFFGTAEAAE